MAQFNFKFKKEDQLKLLLVSVMIFVAVLGRLKRNNIERQPLQADIQDTSFIAENRIAVSRSAILAKVSRSAATLNIQAQKIFPSRRNQDVSFPTLQVKAALAADLDRRADFYRFHTDARWPFASLTKLMTAVVAIEEVGLEKEVIISESAVATEGVSGNLKAGEKYRVGELVKAMLAVSSNDAAMAIAEFYGLDNFVDRMQIEAVNLGMKQTSFADPTGISFLNQGTIEDLEKLVSYIDKNHPAIFKTTAQDIVTIYEESRDMEKELLNINNYASSRPDFLGGKTGFTDEARGNLISIFGYEGNRILLIVLGTDDRFGQTDLLYNWVKNAYAF